MDLNRTKVVLVAHEMRVGGAELVVRDPIDRLGDRITRRREGELRSEWPRAAT